MWGSPGSRKMSPALAANEPLGLLDRGVDRRAYDDAQNEAEQAATATPPAAKSATGQAAESGQDERRRRLLNPCFDHLVADPTPHLLCAHCSTLSPTISFD